MDISYCNELVVLADLLNFSKAAERLYITQPTLSKHVAAAEKETGFRIFKRSTSKVELTESGKVFIDNLREVVSKYDCALQEGRNCQRDLATTVRIVGPLMNEKILSLVVAARSHTVTLGMNSRISMTDTGVRDCVENVLNYRADIAVAFRFGWSRCDLVYEHLFDIPFGIACHGCHPLAKKSPLNFADLMGTKFVSYPLEERANYHEFVKGVCLKHHIDSPVEFIEEGELCFPDAEDSIVLGIHFAGYARFGGDMITRPLDEENDMFDVCAVRRKKETNTVVLNLFDGIVKSARFP